MKAELALTKGKAGSYHLSYHQVFSACARLAAATATEGEGRAGGRAMRVPRGASLLPFCPSFSLLP